MPLPPEFHELARRVNTWGRWGPDDQRGTLNFIDDRAVRRGAECIGTGARFSLAIPLSDKGPQTGAIRGRVNPLRTMVAINSALTKDAAGAAHSDDVVVMGLQAGTHWDSLAHVTYDGRMYNGHPVAGTSVAGAARCGIDAFGPVATRGVLLDVARATGVERIEGAVPVGPDDLDAALALAGVDLEPGDIALIRTGQMQILDAGDRRAYMAPAPGLSLASAAWFSDRSIAAAAADTIMFEVYPGERDDCFLGLHMLCLTEMGMPLGENWTLEALAASCADDGVYTFFLEATPEPFVRGLGGPVNPVAIK